MVECDCMRSQLHYILNIFVQLESDRDETQEQLTMKHMGEDFKNIEIKDMRHVCNLKQSDPVMCLVISTWKGI